jgi:hypothetical protein
MVSMARLPAVDLEAAACTLSPTGAHHWVLRYTASQGHCRHCGEARRFQTTYQPGRGRAGHIVRSREGSDPAPARKMRQDLEKQSAEEG